MRLKTGITVHEIVVSSDQNNNPVTGVTFESAFFINGSSYTGITPTITLANALIGTYQVSFSASTTGDHQFYLKNPLTNVIYLSDVYQVVDDSEFDASATVYVGL